MSFTAQIAKEIWESKYRWTDDEKIHDHTIEETWRRVARNLATVEPRSQFEFWEQKFFEILQGFQFLPGGRILANAGTHHRATLLNCFVMGTITDSMEGIFENLKEGALTMQQGGGVGYDFSTLRPRGVRAKATGRIASGPVSFMRIWNTMCSTILTTGARRGAMMATLRCNHPDIMEFVKAKQKPGELTHFNLSVLVTNEFMQAVRVKKDWDLVFWDEETGSQRVFKTLKAHEMWKEILISTYNYAEPGVIFIDRINKWNNLWYKEHISATNPCGEIPLPPYGACDLGSINLTQFIENPFAETASFQWEKLKSMIPICVRMLDNVIDVSHYPLQKQEKMSRQTRRIGLGLTGLADAFAMLNIHYRSEKARNVAGEIMQLICYEAYRASIELAKEKGAFSDFEQSAFLQGEFIKTLPADIREDIAQYGLRNSHLLAIAPTGTISLLANNISSGIEPIYSFHSRRRVLQADGQYREYDVTDYAVDLWTRMGGEQPYPPFFVEAQALEPVDHLRMQAALQPFVDNSISKTINVSEEFLFDDFISVYDQAYELGLKGCTTFRQNGVTGSVLTPR